MLFGPLNDLLVTGPPTFVVWMVVYIQPDSFHTVFPLWLSVGAFLTLVFSSSLCLTASESVLLQQLFQSKLTQTGSLVLSAPGRLGLRGSKAALLLHKMPTTALVNATASIPRQPRRYQDLSKVKQQLSRGSLGELLENFYIFSQTFYH